MAKSNDPDDINFMGKDPLSPEAYEVLQQAKEEMSGWIKQTLSASTQKLKDDLSTQAQQVREQAAELDRLVQDLKASIETSGREFQETVQRLIATGAGRMEELSGASARVLKLVGEAQAALEAKRKLFQQAGQTTVNIITKFAGVP